MKNNKIVKGGKYGKLTALNFEYLKNYKQYWRFRCDCGNEKILETYNVYCGNTKSCGCKYKTSKTLENYTDGSNLKHLIELDTPPKKNNKLGVKGVYFDRNRNKYSAHIMYQGKRYGLGRYDTIEEATEARREAEEEIKDNTFLENIQARKNRRIK